MTVNDDARTAPSLELQLDTLPLTRLHVFVLLVCALGFLFDLAEIAFGGILSAIFSAPPNAMDQGQLGWLLAAVYIGAIGGAPILGWLADRHGRQRVMFWTLVILTFTSFGAGLSPSPETLILFRGLSGFALGAYPNVVFCADRTLTFAGAGDSFVISGGRISL